jgi:hypothetical protein
MRKRREESDDHNGISQADELLPDGLYHMIDAGVSELSPARSHPPTAMCEMVSRGGMMKGPGTNARYGRWENYGATLRERATESGREFMAPQSQDNSKWFDGDSRARHTSLTTLPFWC